MAYAAVTSLYHTIRLLLTSSRTSVAASTAKILKSARRSTKRLQQTLQKYDEIRNNSEGAMDVRIRDEARKLEDLIESEVSAQFHSQSSQPSGNGSTLSLNLHHLRLGATRALLGMLKDTDLAALAVCNLAARVTVKSI